MPGTVLILAILAGSIGTAIVLLLAPGSHAGIAGVVALLIAPGLLSTLAMGARGRAGGTVLALTLGLSLAFLVLGGSLLAATPIGLASRSLAVLAIVALSVAGMVWAIRAEPEQARPHPRLRIGRRDVVVLGVAAAVAAAAGVNAIRTAVPAAATPLLALYSTTPDRVPGAATVVGIRTEGLGTAHCSVTLEWDEGSATGTPSITWDEVIVPEGGSWSGAASDAAAGSGRLEVMAACTTDGGARHERRLHLEPLDG